MINYDHLLVASSITIFSFIKSAVRYARFHLNTQAIKVRYETRVHNYETIEIA